ncbi:MAG: amidoligase family protein, partial [Pseudomonadota bacterium]|nr:amidoligase family protein [Pseudomonadota bacterium]
MNAIQWKTGFEIELLAPRGASRRDLAMALAQSAGGTVRRCFYPQSEPSLVPGQPVFENLILGFDCFDASGDRIARCVDDLTIRADLDRTAPPVPGWYRIVSDDSRILRLIMAQCDAELPVAEVLAPIAALFGTELHVEQDGIVRLVDETRASLALASGLPGERERPCEVITPAMSAGHFDYLDSILSHVRRLDFAIPLEAATHVHFDAQVLRDTRVFADLVNIVATHGESLRVLMETNPRCMRIAPPPADLVRLAATERFRQAPWEEVLPALRKL